MNIKLLSVLLAASALTAACSDDDNTGPDPSPGGEARVRVVHASPDAPAVDISVTAPGADLAGETPALASVAFGDVADYIEAPAGDCQVRVAPAGTKTVVIASGALTVAAGQVRTAIAVDTAGGGAPFDLLLLPDLS